MLQAESEPPAAEPQETRSDNSWFDEDPGPAGHSEIRLFAGLVVLKHEVFEEWAADVLAGRSSVSTSRDLGQALIPRDQETLHLIDHLLAHYPGDGKTTGIEPTWSDLKHYLERENLSKEKSQRSQLKGPIGNKKHLRRSLHAKHSIALLVQSDGRKMYHFMLQRGGEEDRK